MTIAAEPHLTFIDVLRRRATETPDKLAFVFLRDGETESERFTFADLDASARKIARVLHMRNLFGARALLMFDRNRDFIPAFFGCLYAGVIAVPLYPPHAARPEHAIAKIRAVIDDCRPEIVLTSASMLALTRKLSAVAPDLLELYWCPIDLLDLDPTELWQKPAITGDSIAFLQYTSGSTAAPKGVMVTHHNLVHNVAMIALALEHTADTRQVGWLPLYHDMGLIGNVLQPVYSGAVSILMPPLAFLQRPYRWLKAISEYRAHTSGGPNFAYDLCVRKVSPEQRATLDLRSWQVAFNGAEPVRASTLESFTTAFAPCGFHTAAWCPGYGLAEITLFACIGRKADAPHVISVDPAALQEHNVIVSANGQQLVSCGHGWLDRRICIVDPDSGVPCIANEIGEIWLSGADVAAGYWNKPEATESQFKATLVSMGEGPFLRTGDLGFIYNGELFVTGRLKDLIIIAGHNHYPQDIEFTVEQSHSAIRQGCCAAFSIDSPTGERLVVVAEVDPLERVQQLQSETERLTVVIKAIRQNIALHHDISADDIILIKRGTIPKTSSGKIQRAACRVSYLARTLERVDSAVGKSLSTNRP